MQYKEFGNAEKGSIVLLHGGGMSWWNYRDASELLKNDFRVIIVYLDGHAGSDRHFTSIEDNAAEIISFIDEKLGGCADMICGLSLGGQILLEILSQREDICRHALIESAMAIPSGFTNKLIGPSVSCSYPLTRKKWFAKLQFKYLRIKEDLFDDYYRDTCAVSKADMTAFLKANTSYKLKESFRRCRADVHIYYGEKEVGGIKRSAKVIHDSLPGSKLVGLPGMYHADLSINHADKYAKIIKEIMQNEK